MAAFLHSFLTLERFTGGNAVAADGLLEGVDIDPLVWRLPSGLICLFSVALSRWERSKRGRLPWLARKLPAHLLLALGLLRSTSLLAAQYLLAGGY